MNVYNTKTHVIANAETLAAYGLPITPCQSWLFFDWYELIEGPTIKHDKYIEKLVLSEPIKYDDTRYIRHYATQQLPDAEIELHIRNLKQLVIEQIDQKTRTRIFRGFDKVVPVNGEDINLHFSFDLLDQKNFTDTAAMTVMYLTADEESRKNMIDTVTWNGYKNYTSETGGELITLLLNATSFSDLYVSAVQFRDACLSDGKTEKLKVLNECLNANMVLQYAKDHDMTI